MRRLRRGFTLIELLVVIAIIAVLIGLLVPAVQKVREAANRMKCGNNLRQLVLGAHNYESQHRTFPPSSGPQPIVGTSRASLEALLLPYLEQGNKYNQFDLTQDVNTAAVNAPARSSDVPVYICPSDPSQSKFTLTPDGYGRNNYYGNMGATADALGQGIGNTAGSSRDPAVGGIFFAQFTREITDAGNHPGAIAIKDVTDGTSNTAIFAEIRRGNMVGNTSTATAVDPQDIREPIALTGANLLAPPAACNGKTTSFRYVGLQYYRQLSITSLYTHTQVPNYQGGDCTDGSFTRSHIQARSYHTGGVNVALSDGSVHFITNSISLATWRALGTR